jgi:hypothetical protein
MGPSKMIDNRSTAIRGRGAAQRPNAAGAANTAAGEPGDQPEKMAGSEIRTRWDGDDTMLFFWGNSPAAMERYRKKQEDTSEYMEKWRKELQPPETQVRGLEQSQRAVEHSSTVWSSKRMSAAAWQRMCTGSMGGCVYTLTCGEREGTSKKRLEKVGT